MKADRIIIKWARKNGMKRSEGTDIRDIEWWYNNKVDWTKKIAIWTPPTGYQYNLAHLDGLGDKVCRTVDEAYREALLYLARKQITL